MVRNMASLTQKFKQKALEVGFVTSGVAHPNQLRQLPYGWVGKVRKLTTPEEEFPPVKSVIILAFHTWDEAFFMNIVSPSWKGYGMHPPDEFIESYYLAHVIMKNKAWALVDFLWKHGYDARPSTDLPHKSAAIQCGLGCQGKNTLLVTPNYGPRVSLISLLTTAELNTDSPFKEDLCKDCDRCIRACPTQALTPYTIDMQRCITYSVESPQSSDVPDDVREAERRLVPRPTSNSYIECSTCIKVCPIGKPGKTA